MYITRIGDSIDAFEQLKREGGQLFTAKHKGGSCTHLRGKICTTWWEEDSVIRKGVIRLSREWNLDPEHQTYGRLAKWFISRILQIPHQKTYWHKRFQDMARDGRHWHYLYYVKGDHGYCFEWDLKSAYVNSLFQGKSLLYDAYKGYIDDSGALEALKSGVELLPKPFRLILIGVLASHQKRYWIRQIPTESDLNPIQVTKSWIEYGACFNAVHGAILRLYNLMKRLHSIGGEWIVRCHTDSLLIREDIPPDILERIAEEIIKAGHQITIKGEGRTYLFDLDCGFIGNKPLGARQVLFENMKAEGVTLFDKKLDKEVELQWQQYKKGIPSTVDTEYIA